MQKKSILITGCSSGIGHHAAFALHARGYDVYACARQQKDVESLQANGLKAYRCDLQDSQSIQDCVQQVLAQTNGHLDALFNNAGFGQPGALEDISRADLRAQFETNVFGVMELTRAVIPVMRAQGYGRIIQNSSVLGFVAMGYRGAYNASKYALEGLSDTLRVELRDMPIYVSIIQPGPIRSKFRINAYEQFKKHIEPQTSHHRLYYEQAEKRFQSDKDDPFTLGPEAVVKALYHALEARRPKTRYRVTTPTKVFSLLKRLLPDQTMDAILYRASQIKREK